MPDCSFKLWVSDLRAAHRLAGGSERFGQAGHLLHALVVGVLVVLVRLDQDHAGRPLGARRRAQILKRERETDRQPCWIREEPANKGAWRSLTILEGM